MIRNAQPYDFGGGERIPVQLAVEAAKHQISSIIVSRSPKVLGYAASKDVPYIRGWWWSRQNWSGRNNLLLPVYFCWQIILFCWYVQLILRTGVSVVHPQSKDDFLAATLAAKLLGRRVIWSDYADLKYIFENHPVWYKNPLGKLTYFFSHWASAVILTSKSDETLIKQALGKQQLPKQYVVIYNGVVDRQVAPLARSKTDLNAFVYCATSRLVTAKGIGELIQAFIRLYAGYPDTRLWLAGDGPEAKHFKALADSHEAIRFFGHVDTPLPLVAASDVFVHPSYLEGFSISLIEAAMLGKPMIACDVGGNPEIITDHQTGLLVKDRDSESLYDAMLLLYNDRSLARKLGRQARKRFEKDLRFEKIVAEQFIPLYVNHVNNYIDSAAKNHEDH